MINLDDKMWQEAEGGYKAPYDASVPLKQLEQISDPQKYDAVFEELWGELHHQGDVGLASYLSVPQLVRIAINKQMFHWNILSLCATIEIQRHAEGNPALPAIYQEYYFKGLKELKKFVLDHINNVTDDDTYRVALSCLAVCEGRIKLGKAIFELDDDILEEFLDRF